jgi:hypothetical protein
MLRYIEMEDLAAAMLHDEETIQNSKGESWHGEEVHSRNDFPMIVQKRRPEFAFLVGRRQEAEIARNSTLRGLKSKLKKFTVNSRCTPGRILFNHLTNDSSHLRIDSWPTNAL